MKEWKEYLKALNGMSAHHCQNAFFDIRFGHNRFGIMLTKPSDMMHLYESSILKTALTISWKTYFGCSRQCLAAELTSFAPTFMVEPLTKPCSPPTTGQGWHFPSF
jgi:hypothetical protein